MKRFFAFLSLLMLTATAYSQGTISGGSSGGGSLNLPVLDCQLINSIISDYVIPGGSATATFTRNSTAYVTDEQGQMWLAGTGEARFQGARRRQNLWTNSENFAGFSKTSPGPPVFVTNDYSEFPAGFTNSICMGTTNATAGIFGGGVTVAGRTYVQSFWCKGQLPSNQVNGVGATWITISNVWQRVCSTGCIAISGNCRLYNGIPSTNWFVGVQVEDITGMNSQNPSEYIATGKISSPWYGANVDGVQYYRTQNPISVTNGVAYSLPYTNNLAQVPLGIYMEGGKVITGTYSEAQTNNAAWTTNNCTISNNPAVLSPAANFTTMQFHEDVASSTHYIAGPSVAMNSNSTYSIAVFGKAGTATNLLITLNPSYFSNTAYASFNLMKGSFTEIGSGCQYTYAQRLGNGWWRFGINAFSTNQGTASTINYAFTAGNLGNTPSYQGSTQQYCYIWGSHLEAGVGSSMMLSSYYPTTSSSPTRSGDICWYSYANLGLAVQGSLCIETYTPDQFGARATCYVAAGGGTHRIEIFPGSVLFGTPGGQQNSATNGPTPNPFRAAISWQSNVVGKAYGNGVQYNNITGITPAITNIFVNGSSLQPYGYNRYLKVWNTVLDDNTLKGMTK